MKISNTCVALLSLFASIGALAGGAGHHQHMDHSKMNHGQMSSNMDHSKMNHGQMGHADQGAHHHGNTSVSASGEPGKPENVTKTIELTAVDAMRFKFEDAPEIKSGDVVRFVVTNTGQINHEFSIGNAKEQQAHQVMMRKMPDMVHEDGNSITLKPGETRELIWKFHGDPKVVFACNIPGHAEAGMMHSIYVNQMLSSKEHMSDSDHTVID